MPRERMTPEQHEARVLADPEWVLSHAFLMATLEGSDHLARAMLSHLRAAGFDVVPISPGQPVT